ncbi:MAG: hypothetical protein ACYCS1_05340 [Gammaproteobacteria bacterium]
MLQVGISEDEHNDLKNKAKSQGMKLKEYVRWRLFKEINRDMTFTQAQINEMLQSRKLGGKSYSAIAKKYKTSRKRIYYILNKDKWKKNKKVI